jgi:hypothetical protein
MLRPISHASEQGSSLPDHLAGQRARIGLLRRTWRNLATQDALILAFHAFLLVRAALAPPGGPLLTVAWRWAIGVAAIAASMALLCRGELLPPGRLRGVAYRTLAISAIVLSYFEMRWLLQAMQPVLRDGALLAIDEVVLGATPAVWLERFITPATTQWFAFFYFSYPFLLIFNLAGSAALDRQSRRMHEVLTAGAFVAVIGHIIYTFVPGAGPFRFMHFKRELPQVFWWRQCERMVGNAGAQLDIFPSLHTALPSLFALHAIRHRRTAPFSYLWPVSTLFALNIIGATMFLRWHYAVDVLAGLLLAALAQQIGISDARSEPTRARTGKQPTFEGVRQSELKG